MGNLDKAIVKYHEALSVDPINPHILELLNTALESSVTRPSFKIAGAEGSRAVRTLKSKYTAWQDKGKVKAPAPDEMNIG